MTTRWPRPCAARACASPLRPRALAACLRTRRRPAVFRVGASAHGAYPPVRPALVAGGPAGARVLLRRHGGVDRGIHPGIAAGRVGARRAAFAGHVEGAQPGHAGQSRAPAAGSLVSPSCVGARHLGPRGHMVVAHRAGFARSSAGRSNGGGTATC